MPCTLLPPPSHHPLALHTTHTPTYPLPPPTSTRLPLPTRWRADPPGFVASRPPAIAASPHSPLPVYPLLPPLPFDDTRLSHTPRSARCTMAFNAARTPTAAVRARTLPGLPRFDCHLPPWTFTVWLVCVLLLRLPMTPCPGQRTFTARLHTFPARTSTHRLLRTPRAPLPPSGVIPFPRGPPTAPRVASHTSHHHYADLAPHALHTPTLPRALLVAARSPHTHGGRFYARALSYNVPLPTTLRAGPSPAASHHIAVHHTLLPLISRLTLPRLSWFPFTTASTTVDTTRTPLPTATRHFPTLPPFIVWFTVLSFMVCATLAHTQGPSAFIPWLSGSTYPIPHIPHLRCPSTCPPIPILILYLPGLLHAWCPTLERAYSSLHASTCCPRLLPSVLPFVSHLPGPHVSHTLRARHLHYCTPGATAHGTTTRPCLYTLLPAFSCRAYQTRHTYVPFPTSRFRRHA